MGVWYHHIHLFVNPVAFEPMGKLYRKLATNIILLVAPPPL